MLNSVCLVGRAGSDPEIKTFSSGSILAELRMALTRPGKDKGTTETDWFQVKLWGQPAETAKAYLKKGHLFGITGELQEEHWESNGQKRSKVVVVARTLKLMQPKDSQPAQTKSEEPEDIFGSSDDDEETPF